MNIFYWDWEFEWLYALQGIHNPVLDTIMEVLSNIGNAGIVWILLSLVLLIPKKFRKTGIQMLISIVVTFIIGNLILKNMVMRARPCQIDETVALLVTMPGDYSFPSGHAMNGFTTSVALLYNDKKLGIPAVVLAALIAFSRLYNFVHFPTDVLFGAALGTVVALFVCVFFRRAEQKKAGRVAAGI
jgi:undecaprenyl-diphosphatase